jgi:hypothetical protein
MVRYFDEAEAGHLQAELRANYLFQTVDMLIFSTLIYFAFRNRFNPEAHKRLILIATIALLDAAFARWPILAQCRRILNLTATRFCCY